MGESLTSPTITRTAEYSCKTKGGYTEVWSVRRDVSVSSVAGEKPEDTRKRLEKAAKDLEKTIGGCSEVEFQGLQPTREEQAARKAAMEEQSRKEWEAIQKRYCGWLWKCE